MGLKTPKNAKNSDVSAYPCFKEEAITTTTSFKVPVTVTYRAVTLHRVNKSEDN
jgi:hypothetical protein